MPIVNVKNAHVEERSVNGKNGPMLIRRQMASIELANGYEQPFSVGLGRNPPYPPGQYDIDPRSFAVNQYGDLQLGRYVDLIPLAHKPSPVKA
jgi:hypothetical protein